MNMSYTAGIDLGGTNIAVGIVDEAFRIVRAPSARRRFPALAKPFAGRRRRCTGGRRGGRRRP